MDPNFISSPPIIVKQNTSFPTYFTHCSNPNINQLTPQFNPNKNHLKIQTPNPKRNLYLEIKYQEECNTNTKISSKSENKLEISECNQDPNYQDSKMKTPRNTEITDQNKSLTENLISFKQINICEPKKSATDHKIKPLVTYPIYKYNKSPKIKLINSKSKTNINSIEEKLTHEIVVDPKPDPILNKKQTKSKNKKNLSIHSNSNKNNSNGTIAAPNQSSYKTYREIKSKNKNEKVMNSSNVTKKSSINIKSETNENNFCETKESSTNNTINEPNFKPRKDRNRFKNIQYRINENSNNENFNPNEPSFKPYSNESRNDYNDCTLDIAPLFENQSQFNVQKLNNPDLSTLKMHIKPKIYDPGGHPDSIQPPLPSKDIDQRITQNDYSIKSSNNIPIQVVTQNTHDEYETEIQENECIVNFMESIIQNEDFKEFQKYSHSPELHSINEKAGLKTIQTQEVDSPILTQNPNKFNPFFNTEIRNKPKIYDPGGELDSIPIPGTQFSIDKYNSHEDNSNNNQIKDQNIHIQLVSQNETSNDDDTEIKVNDSFLGNLRPFQTNKSHCCLQNPKLFPLMENPKTSYLKKSDPTYIHTINLTLITIM